MHNASVGCCMRWLLRAVDEVLCCLLCMGKLFSGINQACSDLLW